MEWRPEGWEETKMDGYRIWYENEPFEAGADAMLRVLRAAGVHIKDLAQRDVRYGGKLIPSFNGYLVFIPENK